jgi:hypothetical protein
LIDNYAKPVGVRRIRPEHVFPFDSNDVVERLRALTAAQNVSPVQTAAVWKALTYMGNSQCVGHSPLEIYDGHGLDIIGYRCIFCHTRYAR